LTSAFQALESLCIATSCVASTCLAACQCAADITRVFGTHPPFAQLAHSRTLTEADIVVLLYLAHSSASRSGRAAGGHVRSSTTCTRPYSSSTIRRWSWCNSHHAASTDTAVLRYSPRRGLYRQLSLPASHRNSQQHCMIRQRRRMHDSGAGWRRRFISCRVVVPTVTGGHLNARPEDQRRTTIGILADAWHRSTGVHCNARATDAEAQRALPSGAGARAQAASIRKLDALY
jgi:hypothetical protein